MDRINSTSGFTKFSRVLLFLYIVCGIVLLIIGQHLKNKSATKPNVLSKDFEQILMYFGIAMIILNIILLLLSFIFTTIIDVLVILQFIVYIISFITLLIHFKK